MRNMTIKALFLCLIFLFLLPLTPVMAENEYQLTEPIATSSAPLDLSAKAAILIDVGTGNILYQQHADEPVYPASTTKVLTAMIFLEYFELDEYLVLGNEVKEIPSDSSKAGHLVGETITTHNLLRALLLVSGNDSANAIAVAVAKRATSDNGLSFGEYQTYFADLMNQKAAELGATNSHFVNAHGYHDDDHYTTARDMALFCYAFTQNEVLMDIVGSDGFSGDGADNAFADDENILTQDYSFGNYNRLLHAGDYHYDGTTGLKTGFTTPAGHCVTLSATRDDRSLIGVLFHEPDSQTRWKDSVVLLDYGFSKYAWIDIAQTGEVFSAVPLAEQDPSDGLTLDVLLQEGEQLFLPTDYQDKLTITTAWNADYLTISADGTEYLTAPIDLNAPVGKATYRIGDTTLLTSTLYAGQTVHSATSAIQLTSLQLLDLLFSPQGFVLSIAFALLVAMFVRTVYLLYKRSLTKGLITDQDTAILP